MGDIIQVVDAMRAAQELSVSYMAVIRLISRGELKARKVGREWRIQVSELKKLVSTKSKGA